MPSTNEQHPYEFFIAHFNVQRGSHNDGNRQSRYLKAHINLFGSNSGPLKVKDYVKPCDARLTLHSRNPDEKDDNPVDIRSWGKEPLFLKCARRRRRWDGYITMTKPPQSGMCHRASSTPEFQYITTCVRSRSNQDNPHTSLLFNVEHLEEEEREEDEKPKPQMVHDLQICRENWIQNGIHSINSYSSKHTGSKFHQHFSFNTQSVSDTPNVSKHRTAEPHRIEFGHLNSGQRQKLPDRKYLPKMALTSDEHLQTHTKSPEVSHPLLEWDEFMYTQSDLAPNFLRKVVPESDRREDSHTRPQLLPDTLLVPQRDVRQNATSKAYKEVSVNVEVHHPDVNEDGI